MATSTPWGPSQQSKHYGRGIVSYSCAGHGGFHVSTKLNAGMPEYLRHADGWYEEDCDWAKVALAFPERFTEADLEQAKGTLKSYYPEAYEQHYGVVLAPGESYQKDAKAFAETHKNDLIVLAAWGRDQRNAHHIPEGFVGVIANRGGDRGYSEIPKPQHYFLVPADRYAERSHFGFVIDRDKHQEIFPTHKWTDSRTGVEHEAPGF